MTIKKEFDVFVRENLEKKIKNKICSYCGYADYLRVGDGLKMMVYNFDKREIINQFQIGIVCINCGHIHNFAPIFLFGEGEIEKFVKLLEKIELDMQEITKTKEEK